MKILLTGSRGLFGINFLKNHAAKHQILATYHRNTPVPAFKNTRFVKVDVRDGTSLKQIIKDFSPQVVLHAASHGDVDFCQKNKREAYQVNVAATEKIAQLCKKNKVKLIYLSTNALYDGKHPPYSEKSKPNPINYYGRTKLDGEKKIKLQDPDFSIVRLITMYGWNLEGERDNPATWIIKKLKSNEKIKVVDDIFNNHLYVYSAAEIINGILEKWPAKSTFNVAGKDSISRYEFAIQIAKVFKLKPSLIEPVKSDFFPQIAPRPKNTSFKTDKVKKYLNCKIWSTKEGFVHMQKTRAHFSK